jgi:hypothetical protein
VNLARLKMWMKILMMIYVPNLTAEELDSILDKTLANVEALLKVKLYNPKFFTKAHSDDESILEDSRISP